MKPKRFSKKVKLSISLLSCLVLTGMNTHSLPRNFHSENPISRSYSHISISDGHISDDEWEDSDIFPPYANSSNQSHSFNDFEKYKTHLIELLKGNNSNSTPKHSGHLDEESDLNSTLINNHNLSASFKHAQEALSRRLGSTPKPLTPSTEPASKKAEHELSSSVKPSKKSDLNNTQASNQSLSASFKDAHDTLPEKTIFAPPPPPIPGQVSNTEFFSENPSFELSHSTKKSVDVDEQLASLHEEDSEYHVTSHQEVNTNSHNANQKPNINITQERNEYIIEQTENTNDLYLEKNKYKTIISNHKIKNLYNSGHITLSTGDKPGTGLTISENYIGNNGIVSFSPMEMKNNITSNKLIIKGNSSGFTNVSMSNIGGINSATLNGLELIHVDGLSEGVFNQSGRIVAGAHDYSLVRGHGHNRGNWYLTNEQSPVRNSNNRIERPESASYIANLSASNSLFTTTLSDRLGETQFTDRKTGEKKVTSLWLRQIGNHNRWSTSNNQLKTQSKSNVTLLGGDVMEWSSNGHRRGRLGLMAGYGNNSSNSRSSITNYHSKGSVKGYSIGSYATFFANNTDKSGLYIDGWIQYNWLNNYVQGQGLPKENYQSKGINAAVETGYTIKAGEFIKNKGMVEQWFIQPQAQITKMGVKAKKHREANGTHVINSGEGNIQTRLGVRTYLKGQHAMDKDKNREFEPFIEANWLHNTRTFSANLDGDRVSQAGTRNIVEVKIGVAGKINSRTNIWGNIGNQIADKGYSSTSVTLGIKYNF